MTTKLASGVHEFDIDGVRQVCRVAGEGPVCVVHPGGPGGHSDYLNLPGLESFLTLIYVDPIGSGASGMLPGGDYHMSRYAHWVRTILDRFDIGKAYLLGHSHGGFVAQQFAVEFPERLLGLLLYSTAAVQNAELVAEAGRRMALFAQRWPNRPEAAEALRVWRANTEGTLAITNSAELSAYVAGILPAYFADLRRTQERLGAAISVKFTHDPGRQPSEWDGRDQLSSISARTLVISGKYDFICPAMWAEQLTFAIPDARWVHFTDAGHFAHLEVPQDFVNAVANFVG
jgi:proline iminopeptidase